MYKAIIFDMDGVIFDTEGFYYQRRKTFLDSKGISIEHMEAKEFIGGNLQQVWQKILSENEHVGQADAFHQEYEDYKAKHRAPYAQIIFPEVRQALADLKAAGLKLALASNTQKNDVLFALESASILSYFDIVLSREDVDSPKPQPDIYLKAAGLLEIDKADSLIIEDSQKGISAGKSAGMQVWAIKDKQYGIDQSQADQLIDHLGQVPEKVL
ncbi:HAD family hydrolase [Streptococcus bovimastitidis]|uniref:HAD family hydrolase n=1 Tax=Streptococcus bovimastitidis TaxID=1856638 RepID=A0A1L8MPR4_9STRE|nr:HAD family phosphatase [Streptococcus bovimastitidis]OJF72726.1 HAD family hydrolase [Streptococcus bovimastitidis]